MAVGPNGHRNSRSITLATKKNQKRMPGHTIRVRKKFKQKSLTRQAHKDEVDINNIVRVYTETGHVPLARTQGQYADAPETDFFDAACTMAELASLEEEGKLAEFDEKASESDEAPSDAPEDEKQEISASDQPEIQEAQTAV